MYRCIVVCAATLRIFWPQPSKYFPALKKFLIFSQKSPPSFQETELSCISGKVYSKL